MTRLALGIDLGTSGVRTAVLDEGGNLVSMARGSYGMEPDAYREPEKWWAAAAECVSAQMQALRDLGVDPASIGGVAVDGTSGSLVLTDADLTPVTHALMYDDGGFQTEADKIALVAPDFHIARGPGSALARTLRLVADDVAGRAVHLLHQADFVSARLMGHGGHTDYSNALKTGLDPETGQWPDWLRKLALPAGLLPRAVSPGTPIGRIQPGIAKCLGLPETVEVHAGTTDSVAAFLAAADPEPGAAVTSLGTTLAVKLCSDRRIEDPGLGLYAHRIGETWLVGGASNTGGGVLSSLFSDVELETLSARIDPGIESPLDYYPLLRPGERFPLNDPDLLPRMTPRPDDDAIYLHGIFESIARIEKRAYEIMADRGAPLPKHIITTGGGGQNQTWNAIRSRVLGLPVVKSEFAEAAIGSARLAQP